MNSNKTEGVKPVKERDTLDLLNLVCELHARSLMHRTKELHDASVEARKELESRLSPPPGVEQRAKEFVEDFCKSVYYHSEACHKAAFAGFIAGSGSQGREAVDWKAKYEKCIQVIKRFDPGIIGMYDL